MASSSQLASVSPTTWVSQVKTSRGSIPPASIWLSTISCPPRSLPKHSPPYVGSVWLSSAVGIPLLMPYVLPFVSMPSRLPSSIVAAKKRCQPVQKRSSMHVRKVQSSSTYTIPWSILGMSLVTSLRCAWSVWSWEHRTRVADVVLSPLGRSSQSPSMRSSSVSATPQVP